MTSGPSESTPKPDKKISQSRSYVRHFKKLLSSFLEEHSIGEDATVGDLIQVLDREIVKDALR